MSIYYLIIIIIPVLCSFINGKEKDNLNFFNLIGIFLITVMLAFRKNIGIDLKNYLYYFYNMNSNLDFGYELLNRFVNSIGLPFSALLGIIGFFNTVVMYKFIEKYVDKKNRWISLFLYLAIFDIFIYSLSAIRQSIAISFYLLMLMFLADKKYLKGYLMLVIGFTFHWSILMMLPISLIIRKFNKVKTYKLLALVFIIPSLYKIIMSTENIINSLLFNYNIRYYLNIETFDVNIPKYNIIIYGLLSIIWILFISYYKELKNGGIIKISKGNILNKITEIDFIDWSVFLFLVSKICLAIHYNGALPRLEMFLYFLIPICIGRKLSIVNKSGRMIIMFILSILVWISLYNNLIANPYYVNPGFGLS